MSNLNLTAHTTPAQALETYRRHLIRLDPTNASLREFMALTAVLTRSVDDPMPFSAQEEIRQKYTAFSQTLTPDSPLQEFLEWADCYAREQFNMPALNAERAACR